MPLNIEVLSIGGQFDALIQETAQALNGSQDQFHFALPPPRLRGYGLPHVKPAYSTSEAFDLLKEYRPYAKGDRRHLIGVIDKRLYSTERPRLFGSHNSRRNEGEAVITLYDHQLFTDHARVYLCYYFIRYALSFVCPELRNHDDTRGCFFDRKDNKIDIKKSLDSGAFCEPCRAVLWRDFNEEINTAIQKMIAVMKSLRASSQDDLLAASLKGQVDIGVITMREDEFESMLDRFPSRRHVKGNGSDYDYSRVTSKNNEELRIVVARTPEQGPGAAQALASSMIADLSPRWLFLVGIAGGFPASEYTLGDVLLSQRMHDFAVSAAIEGKQPEFQDMGGPMLLEVEKLVTGLKARRSALGAWSGKQFLGRQKPREKVPARSNRKKYYGDSGWKDSTYKSLKRHFPKKDAPRDPDFFAAVIITSGTLVKDTKLARLWRKTARHASGVEMELGGVCRAARYGEDGKTRVLAIRGISDIVGYNRSPVWTEYACRSAAAFAHALIVSGFIRRED